VLEKGGVQPSGRTKSIWAICLGAVSIVVVGVVVGVLVASNSAAPQIDTKKVQSDISSWANKRDVHFTKVICPPSENLVAGRTFHCFAYLSSSSVIEYTVSIVDSKGAISWRPNS
jgi:hypothetical protein